MNKNFRRIGETIKEYEYPVLNEREVRAGAGIMFLIGIITFFLVTKNHNYQFLYFTVTLFWIDFFIKVFIGPHLSPISNIAKLFVSNQKPDWVGAIQKRFAWSLGLFMATLMIIVAIILQIRGPLPFIICGTCLTFMWLESAMGICIGCKIYPLFIKWKWIKEPEIRPNCPGGVCSIRKH